MTSALPSRAIVTGASGFVGRRLAARLGSGALGLSLRADDWRANIDATSWRDACVYHLAGRVHDGHASDADFERDNVEKTIALAEAASRGGAGRLVFLSTVKVNGEETRDRPFREGDPPAPLDAYGRSKWKAEEALRNISARTGLAVVVVRSPLVVGAGARGNLLALLRLAASPWPLPLAAIRNRRTFIGVDGIASLLEACGAASSAIGRTFLAGDPHAVSTPELLRWIRAAWGRSASLFAVSSTMLESAAGMLGQGKKIRRLTRSLEVDASETSRVLGWTSPSSIESAVTEMARAYRDGGAHD